MAIEIINGVFRTSTTGTLALNFAGLNAQAGDVLLALIGVDEAEHATSLSGWTKLYDTTTGSGTLERTILAFVKFASGASDTVNWSAANDAVAFCAVIRGVTDLANIQVNSTPLTTTPNINSHATGESVAFWTAIAASIPSAASGATAAGWVSAGTRDPGDVAMRAYYFPVTANPKTYSIGSSSGAQLTAMVVINEPVTGPPTFTGSGGVTAPLATLAGAGTHTKPTDTGSGAVVAPMATLAGAGAFTKPTYSGSGALAGPKPSIAGSGLSGQVFSGAGAVSAPIADVDGTGTHTKPTFSASGSLSAPESEVSAAGTFTIRTGSGALIAPEPGVAGAGTFIRVYNGSAALVAPMPEVDATGRHFYATGALVAPTPDVVGVARHFRSTGALTAPMPRVDGSAINTRPTSTGVGAVVAPKPSIAGAAVYTEVDAIIQQPVLDTEDILYGDRVTSYRWEVLEHSNGVDLLIGTLDGVADADLRWQNNAAVKGGGKAQIIDLVEAAPGMMRVGELPLESIRLRPVQIIEGLPENPLGVYLVSNAKEEWDATGRVWDVELLDRATVPQQDVVDESYAVPAGTLILNEVAVILASCGEYIALNEASTLATSNGMAWEAGTSKLKIINDLLDSAGYNSLWMDGYGNFRMTPRVLPADRSLKYDLLGVPREMRDGERAIYRPDWTRERDSFNVPNKVIAVQAAGGEDETALVGQWTNEDNTSPYSYPVRGRWIPHVLDSVETPEGTEAEIIAFLQARARATLVAMSAVQAQVKITHLPIPVRVSEVIRFAHKEADIDTRHVINAIELELRATGLMKSTLQEVISL